MLILDVKKKLILRLAYKMRIFFKVHTCIIHKDNIFIKNVKVLVYSCIQKDIAFFFIPAADLKLKMNRKFIFGLGVLIQNFLYYLHNQNITITCITNLKQVEMEDIQKMELLNEWFFRKAV